MSVNLCWHLGFRFWDFISVEIPGAKSLYRSFLKVCESWWKAWRRKEVVWGMICYIFTAFTWNVLHFFLSHPLGLSSGNLLDDFLLQCNEGPMHDCFWWHGELTFSKLFGTAAVSAVQTWGTGLSAGLDVFCCLSHASRYTAPGWTSSYRACIPQASAEVLGRQRRLFLCSCLLLWVAGSSWVVLLRTGGLS